MTKISGYPKVDSVESRKLQAEQEQAKTRQSIKDKSLTSDDSVIADLTPELSSSEDAESLIQSLASQLENDPDRAVAAQGFLDEDKVKALLEED